MNKIQERIKKESNYTPENRVSEQKEYDYKNNLNWRDDGDELTDPSMNDYLKGYQIDPYDFKQWAKKNNVNLTKTADVETTMMSFTPTYLADRILTLWNGTDGPLQNFFEAFTLRYNNNLKRELAYLLGNKGYEVFPVLVDDKPRYANHKEAFVKIASSRNIRNIISCVKIAFNKSEGFRLFAGEIEDLKESGFEVTMSDAAGLLDYYKQIFPEDYALSLVNVMIETPNNELEEKLDPYSRDFNLSDESLDKIEDYMSGNADPLYNHDGGVGGYNFTSDTRYDTTSPGSYEINSKKKL